MITLTPIPLKGHPTYNERWVQSQIAENPRIIGIGDVVLKDLERRQPSAGRLDLLLQNIDENKRYEVEIQLGATDESHLIRTIEYWDIEQKRYPQYKHCAVIVAEDVTTRFLNVIQLFNGFIPLVAIKMTAYQVKDDIALTFTRILSERSLGFPADDEKSNVVVDQKSWAGYEAGVQVAEYIVGLARGLGLDAALTWKRYYLGILSGGVPMNYMWFHPRKQYCIVSFSIEKNDEADALVQSLGVEVMEYEDRYTAYRVRMTIDDAKRTEPIIRQLITKSHVFYGS